MCKLYDKLNLNSLICKMGIRIRFTPKIVLSSKWDNASKMLCVVFDIWLKTQYALAITIEGKGNIRQFAHLISHFESGPNELFFIFIFVKVFSFNLGLRNVIICSND